MLLLSLLLTLAADLPPAPYPDFPSATITNGTLTAKLYLPDAQAGYYRGTRFDWSGQIGSLTSAKHEYFGKWFDRYDPKLHDAIQGPVEEFNADGPGLGYEDAKPGGVFLRVGVGFVRKPDNKPYERFRTYEIVDPGHWQVKRAKDRITFIHTVKREGYAYVYTKTLRLVGQEMIIEHELRNTGQLNMPLTQYNHQFFVMDGKPTGPETQVVFPFQLTAKRAPNAALAVLKGTEVAYQRELRAGESAFGTLEGFGKTAADYDIRVGRRDTGAQARIRGDKPIEQIVFWSIRTTVCPEPYIRVDTLPGKRTRWSYRYTFE
ncbi:MAG: hypothetical protein K2X03_24230 [Bryobacteraceae bacterium]|nr:hypothetical protein [Bryobacteraceae bacterium]